MASVIEKMLASHHAEALEWLRASSPSSFRNLGELETTEESVALVEWLYSCGAIKVLACKIHVYPEGDQNSGHLLIELPTDPVARAKVFDAARELAERLAFSGDVDTGQQWLFCMLD